ncbi:OmpH family outer membrane protein [bacterium]|nr:OmpH family outer membrane protein [candidate division CSSED10-310 bacterium]
MKKLTILITFLFCCATGIPEIIEAADELKIGYVNAQRIIEDSKAGQDAYRKLKELQDQHKTKVEAKKTEIDQNEAEFQKQYLTLSETAKAEKEADLRQAKKEFKRMLEDADAEIGLQEKSYLETIDRDVMGIIERFGREKGYTLILGQIGSSILYANPEIDLTGEIIKEYDKTFQP